MVVTGLPGTGKSTLADFIGRRLSAAVLAHDWAMSGLRPFPIVEQAMASIEFGPRVIGWSILRALGRSQLRRDLPVVLDGVARPHDLAACLEMAGQESARLVVVETVCSDQDLHRERVERRQRDIPGWYEITWSNVLGSAQTWEPMTGADLTLDAVAPLNHNQRLVADLLDDLL